MGGGVTARSRANGEGSIFPYRNGGYAAYAWITTPAGTRKRKYVYGRTREDVHEKWIQLQGRARQGAVATRVPSLEQYLSVVGRGGRTEFSTFHGRELRTIRTPVHRTASWRPTPRQARSERRANVAEHSASHVSVLRPREGSPARSPSVLRRE
jgi:hypothetical protein